MNRNVILIKDTLLHLPYSCAETEFINIRIPILREFVLKKADYYGNNSEEFYDVCLELLSDSDPRVIVGAISCIFVLGDKKDIEKIKPFELHSNENIRKAAKTCIFELKQK